MSLLNVALIVLGLPIVCGFVVLCCWMGTRLSEKDAERIRRLGEMWARGDDR